MVNFAASTPPTIEYAGAAPPSGSVATTVVTAVVFSGTDAVAVAPPPLELITGASFAAVIETVVLPFTIAAVVPPCAPVLPSLNVQLICTDGGGVSLEFE